MCIYERRAYEYWRIACWFVTVWVKKISPGSYSVHLFKLENETEKNILRWGEPKEKTPKH